MSIKVDQAREEHRRLNEAFRARKVLDSRFYSQVKAAGCDPEGSVLVSYTPDGADTYFGTLIRQDGRVLAFDIALANPAGSEWEDRTEEFLQEYGRNRKSRPWLPTVVAYESFLQERKAKGQSS